MKNYKTQEPYMASTAQSRKTKRWFAPLAFASALFAMLMIFGNTTHAQLTKTYANSVAAYSTNSFTSFAVENRNNAVDGNHATFATLKASPGIVLGLLGKSSYITVQFPSTVAANTPYGLYYLVKTMVY